MQRRNNGERLLRKTINMMNHRFTASGGQNTTARQTLEAVRGVRPIPNTSSQLLKNLKILKHRMNTFKQFSPKIVDELRKRGIHPNAVMYKAHSGHEKNTLLHRTEDLTVARGLLDLGANPNARNTFGQTVLMKVVRRDNDDLVRLLLDTKYKTNVNAQSTKGFTALHYAAFTHCRVTAVKLLLEAGADPNIQSRNGKTALHILVDSENTTSLRTQMVKLLLQHGANPHITNSNEETPLLTAAYWPENVDAAKLMIDYGANVNARDEERQNALMIASDNGDVSLVRILLREKSALDARDKSKRQTALMFATTRDFPEIVELLLLAGASLNLKNSLGQTAMDIARRYPISDSLRVMERYQKLKKKRKNKL
jgi:ankyrin repeat protein